MTDVVPIGGGFYLSPAPAASWARAVAAGCPVTITSAYRSWDTQAAMRVAYEKAKAAGRKVAFTARPENSEHVTGYALDLKAPAIAWMRAHPDYGFVFTDPTESWHVAYRLSNDRHIPPVVIIPDLPTKPGTGTAKDNDMVNDIIWLYQNLLGRGPSPDDILERLGQSLTQIRDDLLGASPRNEPYSIDAAYLTYLGRKSDPEGAKTWAALPTVRAVRAGLRQAKAGGAI